GRKAVDPLSDLVSIPAEDGALSTLEFDVVLRLVSSLARTPPGRERVLSIRPSTHEPSVRALLDETLEPAAFRLEHGRLPFSGVDAIAPILDALAASGGHGLPDEFRPILAVARSSEAVRKFLATAETPLLSARREALPRFETLLERARRLFAADGT